ncbi:MAG: glutaredoxin domain-containing protein [Candidatus Moraniibacteriota bacterium]
MFEKFEKKTIAILLGTLVVVGGLVYWGLQDNGQSQIVDDPDAIVYYYGEGCPHCKVVQDFLDDNDIAAKVSFEKKEVWSDKQNAAEVGRRAKVCGIKPDGMGVPFVYGGDGRCYIGEPDVINFFKIKSGMNTEAPAATQN